MSLPAPASLFKIGRKASRKIVRLGRYHILRSLGVTLGPFCGGRGPLRGFLTSTRGAASRFISISPARRVPFGVGRIADLPETFVATLVNGRAFSDSGAVLTAEHRLVGDVSPVLMGELSGHSALSRAIFPKLEIHTQSIAVMSALLHQRYFHWMFDILPRFDLLRAAGIDPDLFLVNFDLGFQQETLAAIGIDASRILNPAPGTFLQASNLIVPSLPGRITFMSPEGVAFLRKTFLGTTSPKPPQRRLYVSRSDATRRRLLNEDVLVRRLAALGFEHVVLDGMSVAAQVALFNEARLITGPHGAGLTNLAFCQEGASLVEYMPDAFHNPCFEFLSTLLKLDYHCISSKTFPGPKSDQSVDVDQVCHIIEMQLRTS